MDVSGLQASGRYDGFLRGEQTGANARASSHRSVPIALAELCRRTYGIASVMERHTDSSYRAIFKSSSLIGGQQVARILIGMVQTKIIAILLGTSGTGVFGVYASLLNLAQSLIGFGISSSGVRQVASAQASGDKESFGRTVRVLWAASLVLGISGTLALFCLRGPISLLTFGDSAHVGAVGFIALAILPSVLNTSRLAVLQGLRRIRDLSIANVAGTALGAAAAVALIFFQRENGIAPAFAAAALSALLASWLATRRIVVTKSPLSGAEVRNELRALTGLGVAFMAAGLLAALSGYAIRLIIVHRFGVDAAGIYQAAWTLTTFYAVMILQAMGTDFFPRLSAASVNHGKVNVLVNEQAEMGVLMAVPGLAATMVVAPFVLRIFYSADFLPAANVARWMLLGMIARAAGWPLSYLPLAMGKGRLTIVIECIFNFALVAFSAAGIWMFGIEGVGIGFLASSVLYTGVLVWLGRRLTGFRWRPGGGLLVAGLVTAAAAIFSISRFGSATWALMAGGLGCLVLAGLCLARVVRLLGPGLVPALIAALRGGRVLEGENDKKL